MLQMSMVLRMLRARVSLPFSIDTLLASSRNCSTLPETGLSIPLAEDISFDQRVSNIACRRADVKEKRGKNGCVIGLITAAATRDFFCMCSNAMCSDLS